VGNVNYVTYYGCLEDEICLFRKVCYQTWCWVDVRNRWEVWVCLSTVLSNVYVEMHCSSDCVKLTVMSRVHATIWLYARPGKIRCARHECLVVVGRNCLGLIREVVTCQSSHRFLYVYKSRRCILCVR
jgi:hypothetical protein